MVFTVYGTVVIFFSLKLITIAKVGLRIDGLCLPFHGSKKCIKCK